MHSITTFVDDGVIKKLTDFFDKNQQINHLEMDMKSWGYMNKKLTNKSLHDLSKSISQLDLQSLNLNCYCWQYENLLTTECLVTFFKDLSNLKKIEDLTLRFDFFKLTISNFEALYNMITEMNNLKRLTLQFLSLY